MTVDNKIKQVIIMRKDLHMRKGKMAAQAAHASMKVLLDRITEKSRLGELFGTAPIPEEEQVLTIQISHVMNEWLMGKFTKICVSVDSEEELIRIYQEAHEAGLEVAMIIDSGLTEFNGEPTRTCVAIGPNYSEDIDKITGDLKLL